MKKFILATLLMLGTFSLFSQELKNSILLGGTLNYSSNSISSNFNYNTKIGYFPIKNLAAGVGFNGFSSKTTTSDRNYYNTFSPFLRYYFGDFKLKPLIEINHGFINTNTIPGNQGNTFKINYWQGIAGLNYFVNKNAAFELNLNYTLFDAEENPSLVTFFDTLSVNFGVFVLISLPKN